MHNNWRNREFELIFLALACGLGAAFFAFVFFRLSFLLGILVFLIVFLLIFDCASGHRKSLEKMYQASISDSIQVLQNVLDKKGIPYQKGGSDRFVLKEEGIEIQLKHLTRYYGGDPRTIITLIPHDADSWELIFSLRDKLDEAFRPRGM